MSRATSMPRSKYVYENEIKTGRSKLKIEFNFKRILKIFKGKPYNWGAGLISAKGALISKSFVAQ